MVSCDDRRGPAEQRRRPAVRDGQGQRRQGKTVTHPDPSATLLSAWQEWRIPLSEFTAAGVKMANVKKLTIGVGSRTSPTPGGGGILYIDDIGFGHPAP